jgi:hypothetical protein
VAVNAITVTGVSKRYSTRDGPVTALERIGFAVGEGEINSFDADRIAAEARASRP